MTESRAKQLWGFEPSEPPPEEAGFFGMVVPLEQAGVVLVPVPFEATASYGGGSAAGPEAMRRASHQMDFFDRDFGKPYERGIATLGGEWQRGIQDLNEEALALVKGLREQSVEGSADELRARVDELCAEVHSRVQLEVEARPEALVVVIGGDHSVAFGNIAAIAKREQQVGVLHIDAHADLREAYEGFQWSHASIMDNVLRRCDGVSKLVQVGIRDFCEEEHERILGAGERVRCFFDRDLRRELFRGRSFESCCQEIVEALPAKVHISFDIDGLDPALCPSTGTPVPGGLSFHEALFLVECVARSGRRIVGLDLTEVAPGAGEWDANVGARVLYGLIGWALAS